MKGFMEFSFWIWDIAYNAQMYCLLWTLCDNLKPSIISTHVLAIGIYRIDACVKGQ